jgi:Rad3-related DNA helicase
MSILNHFPSGLTPRPLQRDVLLELESKWSSHDVFCLTLPTAAGKTEIGLTIASWQAAQRKQARILCPTNILVEQGFERYPDTQVMYKKSHYECADTTCEGLEQGHRDDCPYVAALKKTRESSVSMMNYYVYMAHSLYADTIIFDESHNVVDMMETLSNIKLSHSKYKFPLNMKTAADVIAWSQSLLKDGKEDERLEQLVDNISRVRDSATVHYETEVIRGKKEKVLRVKGNPITLAKWLMWPRKHVSKIIFMSATTGEQDLRSVGLHHRRICYLAAPSPIPKENRPFIFQPRYNMSFQYVDKALPIMARCIVETLAKHPEKGMIHLPYALAAKLQEILPHPRLMFHDNTNKKRVLETFKNADVNSGAVLVASGLYEGVDLNEDQARWQIIGKVPYLSLADPHINERAQRDPVWYAWSTIKKIVQASGRIVRSPSDNGVTYIFDSNFRRLYDEDLRRKTPLFPRFFRDAIKLLR